MAPVDVDQAAVAVDEGDLVAESRRYRGIARHLAAIVDAQRVVGREAEVAQVAYRALGPEEGAQRRIWRDERSGFADDLVAVVQGLGLGDRIFARQGADVPEMPARVAQEAAQAGRARGFADEAERDGIAGIVDVDVGARLAGRAVEVAVLAVVVDEAALLAARGDAVAQHLPLVVDGDDLAGAPAQRAQIDHPSAAVDEAAGIDAVGADRIGADDDACIVDVGGPAVGGADDRDPVLGIARGTGRGGLHYGQRERQ
jgi:hypothetical protein